MPPVAPRMESFRLALRQFGYIEGQTVAIELRYAEKGVRQLPELAAELVSRKVDVITAFGDLAPQVAQQATGRIPIVAICDRFATHMSASDPKRTEPVSCGIWCDPSKTRTFLSQARKMSKVSFALGQGRNCMTWQHIFMNKSSDPRLVWVATVLAVAVCVLYIVHI
jgi:hypothetical protein